ncbi:NAD(P)/FAD-dependent oxidoreductase [Actinacidiphila oryziradicis]|nr:tryptophan 7-halogenase [Actinacidiphila oryziradicis]
MVLARRSTFEFVLRERTEARAGVRTVRGARVVGLITAPDDPCRVIGVHTADGRTWTADLVVDASGRRTDLSD